MTLPDHPVSTKLDARQQILRKKISTHLDTVSKARPTNDQGRYAQMIAKQGDWIVQEQPVRTLPLALSQLITISSRDLGNALIEETRQLNNQYAGVSFRDIEAMLAGDPACEDLQQRILTWSEDVAAQITFKLRHRAKDNPIGTFDYAYGAIVKPLDQDLIHGSDRMYMRVWSCVVDMLPYKLWDAFIAAPGHVRIEHDSSSQHFPKVIPSARHAHQVDVHAFHEMLSLYGIESEAYLHNVVLAPLLEVLKFDEGMPSHEEMRARYAEMFADILEAAPYLMASERSERFKFELPGSNCVATFQYSAGTSCAQFVFFDDEEKLRHGLRTTYARGALMLAYDGSMSFYMHPWKTTNRAYGDQQGTMIAYWLVSQVHARVLADFLKIERYFLHTDKPVAAPDAQEDVFEETLAFVSLAKAAPGNNLVEDEEPSPVAADSQEHRLALPQLRRRYFFKLLEHCGVRVEQGKGSELKLLRDGGRPFRLGNHYGSNPTVPAFLAANILKRLEITRDEWLDALALG